jgi:hypothetical protein
MAEIILAQFLPPYLNLPNLDDLACDDGIPMDTEQHKLQNVPKGIRNPQQITNATVLNN